MCKIMKICKRCGVSKDIDDFPWRNREKEKKHERCKSCLCENVALYKFQNQDKVRATQKTWYETKGRIWRKQYTETHKDLINENVRNRYKTDVNFRLRKVLRSRFTKTLKGKKASRSILRYVGMELGLLKEWFEYQFDDSMCWETHGSFWDIDHVIPCSHFDLSKEEQVSECFHWSNLRPLEKSLNNSKNSSYDVDVIESHKCVVHSFKAFNPSVLTRF
jgi:hypothetical protein